MCVNRICGTLQSRCVIHLLLHEREKAISDEVDELQSKKSKIETDKESLSRSMSQDCIISKVQCYEKSSQREGCGIPLLITYVLYVLAACESDFRRMHVEHR